MAAIWGEISAVNPTYKFKWVIHDFRIDSRKVGEAIKSSPFAVTNIDSKYQWQFLLYPRGNTELHKEYCAVGFLNRASSKAFKGTVTFSLIDSKGNSARQIVVRDTMFGPGQSRGNPRFFSRRFVSKKENGVLDDEGKLTIMCEIDMGPKSEEKKVVKEMGNERMAVEEKTEEKVDESALRLKEFDEFEHLVNEKAFSDVIFIVGDKHLYAHRCILSTRSPVFAAMFLHEMRENLENKVEVKGVNHDVFREMLRFIYTGKVNRFDLTVDIFIAADRYALDTLKSMCERKLCDGFTDSTALQYLQLADKYRAKSLRETAMQYIISHASVIVKSAEFKQLPNDLVVEICGAMATKLK